MSSRQEEKAKRRAEREEQQRKEAQRAASTRRLQIVGGVILAIAAVAAIVVAVTSGGGSDDGPKKSVDSTAKIPAQKITDLQAAAKAAGCVLRNFPNYGQDHVTKKVKYKTNPPTSGPHNPVPAQNGVYEPGNAPAPEAYVHTLEHGRIEIQYRPGTPLAERRQLETLYNEPFKGTPGYLQLLFENNTGMPYAVAATAWQHILGCRTFNPRVFDAIRAFRTQYADKAPEPSSVQPN